MPFYIQNISNIRHHYSQLISCSKFNKRYKTITNNNTQNLNAKNNSRQNLIYKKQLFDIMPLWILKTTNLPIIN